MTSWETQGADRPDGDREAFGGTGAQAQTAREAELRAILDTGTERVVRGGSFANRAEDRIGISTRGGQPPDWCTAFTGFRVVLAPR